MLKNDNGEAAAEFYDKRRLWAEYASTHPKVTDRAFRVGYWLSRRMNGEDRCCWYSVKRIAKELGRSPRYVQYAVAELRAANVIIVIEDKGKPNAYFLHAPFI
jgi:hypothetical protein